MWIFAGIPAHDKPPCGEKNQPDSLDGTAVAAAPRWSKNFAA
jgi:hypothetical protein